MNLFKKSWSNEDLISGCSKNSRKHQEYLYRKYFNYCRYVCEKYTKDPDKVLDIINNAFLKVFKNIHTLQNSNALKSWIGTIVIREVSNYFKVKINREKLSEINDNHIHINNLAEEELNFSDVYKIISDLPEITRIVFLKRAIEGYKHKEIALELKIPEGTSKWHFSQARKILQQKLSKLDL